MLVRGSALVDPLTEYGHNCVSFCTANSGNDPTGVMTRSTISHVRNRHLITALGLTLIGPPDADGVAHTVDLLLL